MTFCNQTNNNIFLDVTTFVSDVYDLVITNPQHSLYNFPNIAEKHFAEQLTRMDRVCIIAILLYFHLNISQ